MRIPYASRARGGRYAYLPELPANAARRAVRAAFAGGGRDGVSVVCRSVYCVSEPPAEAPYVRGGRGFAFAYWQVY